jgi:hypothetical protein
MSYPRWCLTQSREGTQDVPKCPILAGVLPSLVRGHRTYRDVLSSLVSDPVSYEETLDVPKYPSPLQAMESCGSSWSLSAIAPTGPDLVRSRAGRFVLLC